LLGTSTSPKHEVEDIWLT